MQGEATYCSLLRAITVETYTCAQCHNTYNKVQTEEAALLEAQTVFGHIDKDDLAIVCDDCYEEFMKWYGKRHST